MNTLNNVLESLELKPVEIKLYNILFREKYTSLSSLSLRLGVSRKTLYTMLEKLAKQGVVEKSKNKWLAAPPKVLKILLDNKLHSLTNLQNQFDEDIKNWDLLWVDNGFKTNIKLHQGEKQLKLLYDKIIYSKEEYLYTIGSGEGLFGLLGKEYAYNWVYRRSRHIKVKTIVAKSDYNIQILEKLKETADSREVKLINFKLPTTSIIIISGQTCLLIDPTFEQVIEFHNRDISYLFKNLFDIIWNS